MPNFKITAPPSKPRFEDDFLLAPDAGHQPTADEQAYVDELAAALARIVDEEAADVSVGLPDPLLADRRQARKDLAVALKADARKFIVGHIAATAAAARIAELGDSHANRISKFGTRDRQPSRFAGDFELALMPDYLPTAEEQAYLKALQTAVDELAADEVADAAASYSQFIRGARQARRTDSAKQLCAQVRQFWKERNAAAAVERVLMEKGRYRGLRDRLTRRLFNVYPIPEDEKKEGPYAVDLDIKLISGLPAPEDEASPEKRDLFVAINKAGTVIRTVCQRIHERAEKRWWRKTDTATRVRAQRLLDEYMSKLHGIAVIGLELSYTPLASAALGELRNEFFAQEAGRIKKNYVRLLGIWAGAAAFVLFALYASVVKDHVPGEWWFEHKNFLLAAAGAAIGTWISFSVRQVQFTFDDLVMLEEDSLDPPLRVVFVVGLTLTACLLFWTGAINIEIGNLKTASASFREAGSIALLIGIFAGLSERALATAISGRAASFVKTIGG